MVSNRSRIILISLLVFAFCFCIYEITYNYPPYHSGDYYTYPYLAQRFLNGTFHEYNNFIFSERILYIVPMAFFIKTFGFSLYATGGLNIFSYLGLIIVMFYIGRELFDENAGIFASVLITFYPFVATFAYVMEPDMVLIFASSLFALSFLYWQGKKSSTWGFLTGVFLVSLPLISTIGAAVTIIMTVYLACLYAYQSYKKAKKRPNWACLIYGIFVAILCTALFNYIFSGNPIITITSSSGFYGDVGCGASQNATLNLTLYDKFGIPTSCGNQASAEYSGGSAAVYLNEMFPYSYTSFQDFLEQLLYQHSRTTTYYYFAVPALLYLFYTRQRKSYFMAFWLVAGLSYLCFGPAKVTLYPFHYVFVEESWKYLSILSVPLILLISAALARFCSAGKRGGRKIRPFATVLVILFIIATSLTAVLFI